MLTCTCPTNPAAAGPGFKLAACPVRRRFCRRTISHSMLLHVQNSNRSHNAFYFSAFLHSAAQIIRRRKSSCRWYSQQPDFLLLNLAALTVFVLVRHLYYVQLDDLADIATPVTSWMLFFLRKIHKLTSISNHLHVFWLLLLKLCYVVKYVLKCFYICNSGADITGVLLFGRWNSTLIAAFDWQWLTIGVL